MKADVFPTTASLRLDIPSWLPEPIAQYVSAKYATDVNWAYREALTESGYLEDDVSCDGEEYLDELIRNDVVREDTAELVRDKLADITERYLPLACDRRMERVWRELSRQRNGAFLHPAPPLRASSAANAKERQDAAMLELFKAAFACQKLRGATTTRRQAEQRRNCYLAKADELRNDAIVMLAQPPLFMIRASRATTSVGSVLKSCWMQPKPIKTMPA
jgi:hypothetical protein